jgi:hypothetical protein
MGSWSEGCGISGIEIECGDAAYACLLKPNKNDLYTHGAYNVYTPASPLLKGTYNDYGQLLVDDSQDIIDAFAEETCIHVKNGMDFAFNSTTDAETYKMIDHRIFFVRADVMEFLPNLPRDFPFVWVDTTQHKVKTIGEAIAKKMEGLRESIANNGMLTARDLFEVNPYNNPSYAGITP